MKLILGVLLTLTSASSFAVTGECRIEGYAQKTGNTIYRFLNQAEYTTLAGCQAKAEKTAQALEQCYMVPMGRVSHLQMTFNGAEQVKSVEYVNANCDQPF